MRYAISGLLVVLFAVLTLAGCAPSPRQRPLNTSPIESGAQTMEAARKVLEGSWTLVSLNVAAVDGRSAPVEANGLLVSDAFGNLNIEYRLSEAGLKTLQDLGFTPPNPVISTNGRVVINPQQRQITYVPPDAAQRAFDPELAANRANPFALERQRYYALGADGILTLTTRHDNGRDAATSRWKRNS